MAGDPFSITIDDAQVRARLKQLADNVKNPSTAMRAIRRALLNITEDAFAAETSPFGLKWPDLDEDYVERSRKEGGRGGDAHPILQRTGQMAASVHGRAGADFAEIGVAKIYAAIHQFGGEINHPARSSTVYFKLSRDKKSVGTKFVKKKRSDFAQDVQIGAYTQHMKKRAFLPVDQAGNLAPVAQQEILAILNDYLK